MTKPTVRRQMRGGGGPEDYITEIFQHLDKLEGIDHVMKQTIDYTMNASIYGIATLLIIGLIVCISVFFLFDITVLSGFSQITTALTSLLTIIFIIYLIINSFLLTSDIFNKPSTHYSENIIIYIAKVILSSIYASFFVIINTFALGFLLSLSYNLSSSNYNNFINPIFYFAKVCISSILFIIMIIFIFPGNFKKVLNQKYPFVILATCLQYSIFIALLFMFKLISDSILNNILIAPDVRNMKILENLDTGAKITTEKISKIQNNIQSLSDLFILDDYSALDNNNFYYQIYLGLYVIYMITIVFGLIVILVYNYQGITLNYQTVSKEFGNAIKRVMIQFFNSRGLPTDILTFNH